MRLIDADTLIDDLKKYLNKLNPSRDGKECTRIYWLIGVLSNAPTVEPERKVEELLPDGTLHLFTDTDLSKVNRVLVSQNGTHYGDLYYADEERKTGKWIPIKWHDCTDADREKYGFSDDIVAVFDCEMPDDDQAILVTTSHGYVNQDVCYIDDGYSLDSGYDWIDDITAWMPLPECYRGENDG